MAAELARPPVTDRVSVRVIEQFAVYVRRLESEAEIVCAFFDSHLVESEWGIPALGVIHACGLGSLRVRLEQVPNAADFQDAATRR